ncbi:hypothetical protein RJT34_18005 [Clitoria ternatea]|uniref:Mesoderm development candidate 2 n=1 Tax=Clitoria ternatea TaxID=43366 RepID=A0AAN9PE81_CLITE
MRTEGIPMLTEEEKIWMLRPVSMNEWLMGFNMLGVILESDSFEVVNMTSTIFVVYEAKKECTNNNKITKLYTFINWIHKSHLLQLDCILHWILFLMNLKALSTLLLLLLLSSNSHFALAGKRRVHITDDLDDVHDDEEDDAWRDWGKKPTPSFPPSDFTKLDPSQIQEEMTKRHTGPVIGFVKLRFGVHRTPDTVAEIAMKWTQVLRTGAVGVRFMGVDLSTVMFNLESIKDLEELKEFVLDQPEAYEIKMGDQFFRRPGDPPLDEVIEKLNSEKGKEDSAGPEEIDENLKIEL